MCASFCSVEDFVICYQSTQACGVYAFYNFFNIIINKNEFLYDNQWIKHPTFFVSFLTYVIGCGNPLMGEIHFFLSSSSHSFPMCHSHRLSDLVQIQKRYAM